MKLKTYYLSKDGTTEVIDIIESYNLSFAQGSALKYILRAGLKTHSSYSDIEKAISFLCRDIEYGKHNILPQGVPYPYVVTQWDLTPNIKLAVYELFMSFTINTPPQSIAKQKRVLLDKCIIFLSKELNYQDDVESGC